MDTDKWSIIDELFQGDVIEREIETSLLPIDSPIPHQFSIGDARLSLHLYSHKLPSKITGFTLASGEAGPSEQGEIKLSEYHNKELFEALRDLDKIEVQQVQDLLSMSEAEGIIYLTSNKKVRIYGGILLSHWLNDRLLGITLGESLLKTTGVESNARWELGSSHLFQSIDDVKNQLADYYEIDDVVSVNDVYKHRDFYFYEDGSELLMYRLKYDFFLSRVQVD